MIGKITDNREIRAVRFNLRPKSKKKIQRKEGRSGQGHSAEHLLFFRNRVSLRFLVSRPEPLQFQSKWQCFSEGSSSNVPTTKNWIYKSLDVPAKKCQGPPCGPQASVKRGPLLCPGPTPLGTTCLLLPGPRSYSACFFSSELPPPTLVLRVPLTPRLAVE